MPAAPSAPAPVATPTPSAPAPNVGSAVPSSKGIINVIPQPAEGLTPAKSGSATKDMFARLQKKAEETEQKTLDAIKPPDANKPEAKAAVPGKPEDATSDVTDADDAAKSAATKPELGKDGKPKVNPWKLSEEYKAKATKLEGEVAELRKAGVNPETRKSELAKYEAIEKRARELEDHIRYIDYSKSNEFSEKYQQPYDKAWKLAMSELSEIVAVDPQTGHEKPMSPQNLLELVNMPLNEARKLAVDLYGDSANDVMSHRKEIKQLFLAKSAALEEARTTGAERIKQQAAQHQEKMGIIQKSVAENWERENQAIIADEKLKDVFNAAHGDDEGKTRLEKGYKFVDEAFKTSPLDPKLTDEQRATVIKQHAAVRNRAAAFGHQRLLLERERAAHEATKKKLAEFEGTTPDLEAGRTEPAAVNGSKNTMASLTERLQARAK